MKRTLFLFLFLFAQIVNAAPSTTDLKPLHEAFVPRNRGLVPLEVIGRQPPAPIVEVPPPQENPQTMWIAGYWSWLNDKQDFVWVCGVWRLPPPERIWTSGYWKDVQGGWVWISGAWMPDQAKTPWIMSKEPPPSPQNENAASPPSQNYFWFSGYWELNSSTGKFQWLSGSWQKFDSQWIIEPAHWIWRPDGYLFVPTYWDCRLEVRGQIYDCTSHALLSPQEITREIVYTYPDYQATCSYYWYYFPEYWEGCDCIPIWWYWQDWATISWDGQWWLWWWWVHPGFPAPPWLPGDVIIIFPQPPIIIIDFFDGFPVPWFISPFGVPPFEMWIEAIGIDKPPFLTPPERLRIIDRFPGRLSSPNTTRPGGSRNPGHLPRPNLGGPITPPAGPAVLPTVPVTPPTATRPPATVAPIPPVPTVPSTPVTPPSNNRYTPPPSYNYNPPTYTPPSGGNYVPPQTYYPPSYPSDNGVRWNYPDWQYNDHGRDYNDWHRGDRDNWGDRGRGSYDNGRDQHGHGHGSQGSQGGDRTTWPGGGQYDHNQHGHGSQGNRNSQDSGKGSSGNRQTTPNYNR